MCTATIIARRTGYVLGMNRDEQRSRVDAIPAAAHRIGNRFALYPSEPSGGTWIGVNDSGIAYALLNWYSVPHRVVGKAVSRGEIVPMALPLNTSDEVTQALTRRTLAEVNPFRLIGVFPEARAVVEWCWDRRQLQHRVHPWRTGIWISSGFDEPAAQRIRGRTFGAALDQKSVGTGDWLRRFHRSHAPECGPNSICMHRPEAATVSYTEIDVSPGKVRLTYTPGAPCCTAPVAPLQLESTWDSPRKDRLERQRTTRPGKAMPVIGTALSSKD